MRLIQGCLAEVMADSGHYSIDSTTVRAHVSAAGGKGGGTHRRALGRSRGGFTSKLYCLADALGRPLAFHLTVGEAADCKACDALIGLPGRTPKALLADKGYDADAIRADLAERKIKAVIPGRSNRRVKIEHDRALYKQRNRIERMFGHLKINRAIATRYDQLPTASSAWSTSPPPDTGSNLSTPPSIKCLGGERMQAAYAHAIADGYRFYSYGDASLLLPAPA